MADFDPILFNEINRARQAAEAAGGSSLGSYVVKNITTVDPVTQGQAIWFTPGVGVEANQATLPDPFRVDQATLIKNTTVLSTTKCVRFAPDGLSGFLIRDNSLIKITMTVAHDLDTRTETVITSSVNTAYGLGIPTDAIYADSGNMIITVDEFSGNFIRSVTLSTPYDVGSTITNTGQFTSVGPSTKNLAINADGTEILVNRNAGGGEVYSISTPYNLSTATGPTNVFYGTYNYGVYLADDGVNFLAADNTNVASFTLDTPNSFLGGITATGNALAHGTSTNMRSLEVGDSNNILYVVSRFDVDAYGNLLQLQPNPDSFKIGNALASGTTYDALIESIGSATWAGALPGDILAKTSSGTLELNTAGITLGYCIDSDFIDLVKEDELYSKEPTKTQLSSLGGASATNTIATISNSGFVIGVYIDNTAATSVTIPRLLLTYDEYIDEPVELNIQLIATNFTGAANSDVFVPLQVSHKGPMTIKLVHTGSVSPAAGFKTVTYYKEVI